MTASSRRQYAEMMLAKAQASMHVACIMDGNGRWAARQGLPRMVGHRRGAARAKEIVAAAPDLGITHLTLYAFSTENWRRPIEEVVGLTRIFSIYIRAEAHRLLDEGVKLRFIGDRAPLDPRLRRLMDWSEALTQHNTRLVLTVAINYGGRAELIRAAQKLVDGARNGLILPDDVDEDAVTNLLTTAGLPDPDLIIRTSGETRISNFMLWQSAYAEYEFIPTLWPDFTTRDMETIVQRFRARDRRFGAVPDALGVKLNRKAT